MSAPLSWRSGTSLALQAALLASLGAAFFMRAPIVSGLSMAPDITSGEIVLINTVAFRLHAVRRGDIVAFHHDGITPEVYLKRVIGIPGDRVRIEQGVVYVNGSRILEPYVHYSDTRSFAEVVVPPNAYYVLGDNRADSDDSRAWGFVRSTDVIGQAIAGIWPPRHLGAL